MSHDSSLDEGKKSTSFMMNTYSISIDVAGMSVKSRRNCASAQVFPIYLDVHSILTASSGRLRGKKEMRERITFFINSRDKENREKSSVSAFPCFHSKYFIQNKQRACTDSKTLLPAVVYVVSTAKPFFPISPVSLA